MSRLAFFAAFAVLLTAPAFAQDMSSADAGTTAGASSANATAPAAGPGTAGAAASSDIFLRNEESSITPAGEGFLRGAPINLQGGAYADQTYGDTSAQDAAAKVYSPDAELNALAGQPAVTPAPDYSAAAYNTAQTKAVTLTATREVSSSGIVSPFPDWFGNYAPPKPPKETKDGKTK